MSPQLPRRLLLALVFAIFSSVPARAADSDFDALLAKYVRPGTDGVPRVDYRGWRSATDDVGRLNGYIAELSRLTPSRIPKPEAFAYWVNLYNAVTLKVVLDRYPVASIRDIKSDGLLDPKAYLGPWRTKRVTVEGRSYSLDDIEHEVLRPVFKDPRVHYALNCASIGCPNLRARAWSVATLDSDLNAAARDFVNHPRGVRVQTGGELVVSSIYKWFAEDFGGDRRGIFAHLRKYADPRLSEALGRSPEIAGDQYDWRLNDASGALPTR